MVTPNLFVFSMLLFVLFVITSSSQNLPIEPEDAISSLRIEIEQLKTKVSILESTIQKSDAKLKSKDDDDSFKQEMGNIMIAEKSQSTGTTQNMSEELQLQKVNGEQKIEVHMTGESFEVIEEETMKAGMAASFVESLKSLVAAGWNFSWMPDLDALSLKGWIPAIKDQWSPFLSSLSSQFEPSTAKIIEAYGVTENLLLSNMAKIQMTAALFMQELPVMKDQWLTFIYSLRSSLESIISCHIQVQQWLKTNELTRSLASIELAWFVATALLCLPVVGLCRFYSAMFRKRGKKLRCTCHPDSIRGKSKRPLNFD